MKFYDTIQDIGDNTSENPKYNMSYKSKHLGKEKNNSNMAFTICSWFVLSFPLDYELISDNKKKI